MPLHVYISRCRVVDEAENEVLFRPELNGRVDSPCDVANNFLILAVAVMILLYEKQYIVDIYFYLPYKLDLKDNVVIDILCFVVCPRPVLVEVDIYRLVVLEISFRENIIPLELVECCKDVSESQE